MASYVLKIFLDNQKQNNTSYNVVRQLSGVHEDNPELFFTKQTREEIRGEIQDKTSCFVNDTALISIINSWLENIRLGYRITSLNVSLTSMAESKLALLKDNGNLEIPELLAPVLEEIKPPVEILLPLEYIFQ
ncbi:MAG: hypothetical protein N5P05_002671 [Chroococcopsis gigantea SAG 12.99]|jgi:hypothetical protein|nr:hypothetical protein [Chlorogloea purpurea SAG 13.99]MDV3001065.1 hypothetical protein [Chroococcopsis gigantea SAG 12.99]